MRMVAPASPRAICAWTVAAGFKQAESTGQFGGGSLPGVSLRSVAVEMSPRKEYPDGKPTFNERLFQKLLSLDRPILGILRQGKLLFDVLAIQEKDIEYMSRAISDSIQNLMG